MACLTLIPTRARSISVIFSGQSLIIVVYTTYLSRSNIYIQWLESLVISFYEEGKIADFNRLSAGFGWQSWRCVVCSPSPTTFTGSSCPLLGELVFGSSWSLSVSVLTLHTCRSRCESEMLMWSWNWIWIQKLNSNQTLNLNMILKLTLRWSFNLLLLLYLILKTLTESRMKFDYQI